MMVSKKYLEVEIEKAKAAVKTLKEGLYINEIVLQAFETELSKLK